MWGFVAGCATGGKLGHVCLSNNSKLCFESLGSSLMAGDQGTKMVLGHCPSPGGWDRKLRLRAQGALRCLSPKSALRMFLWGEPCYPRGICLARQLCWVQETANHTGVPPVQILKISHFRNKVFFVQQTKGNMVKKIKIIFNPTTQCSLLLTFWHILFQTYVCFQAKSTCLFFAILFEPCTKFYVCV